MITSLKGFLTEFFFKKKNICFLIETQSQLQDHESIHQLINFENHGNCIFL